jgi:Transglutaminase-like superfamily
MTARTKAIRLINVVRQPRKLVAIGESVLLLGTAEISLRVADLPRVARWFGATLEFTDAVPSLGVSALDISPSERQRLVVLSRVARHWPLAPKGACLRHSLSASYMLRTRRPSLRLSVGRLVAGDIAAHAWVEVNGTAVTDPGDFAPLSRRAKSEPGWSPPLEAGPPASTAEGPGKVS